MAASISWKLATRSCAAAISRTRTEADLSVATEVDAVNTALQNLKEVDRQLAQASARGASTAEYEDKRDTILADIATKLPIRIYDNGPGKLLVTSDGGSTLYDSGTVHALSFTHTPGIASDLRRNGVAPYTNGLQDIAVGGMTLRISDSGSIAGHLAETFQTADPSRSGMQAGLFTRDDDGDGLGSTSFDPAAPPVGMARTIAINPQVDPDQGGKLWRMRDGMQAGAEGKASDNSIILGWLDAMEANRSYPASTGLAGSMGLSQATSQAIGLMQGERATWTDRAATRGSIALQAREDLTNKTAVNVDEELQRLLMVQQTYSASVQVIQAATKMLDQLSSLGG
jgi:flagellar hook-associated protein 1 FlgK